MFTAGVILRAIIFLAGCACIAVLSRRSLVDPRSHGFYRAFAFAAVLGLVLLGSEHWFDDPFSPRQIASWLLLIASILMVLSGFQRLVTVGKPRAGIETTTQLVTNGIYRFIRHPLYSSLLFLGAGAFLKRPSILAGILLLILAWAVWATARTEEKENIARFGAGYEQYMRRSRRFLPFIW